MRPTATVTVSFPWGERTVRLSAECDLSLSGFHPLPRGHETADRADESRPKSRCEGPAGAAGIQRFKRRQMAEVIAGELVEAILAALEGQGR